MARIVSSEKVNLFSYFILVILAGAFLLYLPISWRGPTRLAFIDALFTSTSAVCVTGLSSVNTALYTRFGQVIIMLLIQAGGLGIIAFTTLYLATPRRKVSFRSLRLVKEYYIDTVEHDATHIVRNILVTTFSIEAVGTILLYFGFEPTVHTGLFFTALFHAISAFCNAGFSTFSNGLVPYVSDPFVSLVIMALIVLGGIGFVVIQDLLRRATGERRRLHFHTRIVLASTSVLIVGGLIVYYLLERNYELKALPFGDQILAAGFQSVTTRTAGFNTISESGMTTTSKLFTLILMFIGGAPGSTAGGIKVSTAAIILLAMLKDVGLDADLNVGRRKIGGRTIARAHIFALRALVVLFISVFLLTLTELHRPGSDLTFLQIVFESFSAFGTVGLSLGATHQLSYLGKIVIILTMFTGRVGLISFAIQAARRGTVRIDYPEGEVLIG